MGQYPMNEHDHEVENVMVLEPVYGFDGDVVGLSIPTNRLEFEMNWLVDLLAIVEHDRYV